jgi:hypothetical protein
MAFENIPRDRVPVHALIAGKRARPQFFVQRAQYLFRGSAYV